MDWTLILARNIHAGYPATMTSAAQFESTPTGQVPTTAGWFAINLAAAAWGRYERFGATCRFEGAVRFKEIGINVRVLQPGQPNCLYHRENLEENFLVLHGECVLIVEGEERILKQWDFFHSPPETNHVFVGAGDGPCAILMVGTRDPDEILCYPVDPVAQAHGAGVDIETPDPKVGYAGIGEQEAVPAPAPFASGQDYRTTSASSR